MYEMRIITPPYSGGVNMEKIIAGRHLLRNVDSDVLANFGMSADEVHRWAQKYPDKSPSIRLNQRFDATFISKEDFDANSNKPASELIGKQEVELEQLSGEEFLAYLKWLQYSQTTGTIGEESVPAQGWLRGIDLNTNKVELTAPNGNNYVIYNSGK
jgi:hypothetical protein